MRVHSDLLRAYSLDSLFFTPSYIQRPAFPIPITRSFPIPSGLLLLCSAIASQPITEPLPFLLFQYVARLNNVPASEYMLQICKSYHLGLHS